jgi:hypothetical protein
VPTLSTGAGRDKNWSAVTIGPDARVYVGTLAGLQVFLAGN